MIADWPRSSVVMVVGILSSSTQIYSGSLATSPKRGFLMSSHLGSAALISTEGSSTLGRPASSRRLGSSLAHAVSETAISARPARRHSAGALIAPKHSRFRGSILLARLPGEALVAPALGARKGLPSREEGRTRDRGDPGHVEIGHPPPLEEHRHEPRHHVEGLAEGHRAIRPHQELLAFHLAVEQELVDLARIHALEALGLVHGQREHEGDATQIGIG